MEWPPSTTQLAILVPLTIVCLDVIRRFVRNRIERQGFPLPPGPTPLPFFGSAFSINTEAPYKTYTAWRARYGDIIYARVWGMDVVILNSLSVVTDLLEKRSQIYSDRPLLATVVPYGHDRNFALTPYGEHWRLCRRIFHQTFRADTTHTFHPIQLRKVRQLVLNIMNNPSEYASYYSTFSAAVATHSLYDYEPSPLNDRFISIIDDFVEASGKMLVPERAVLFRIFPFLLHIPDWLPGSTIKYQARTSRELGGKMVEAPYQYVQRQMKSKEYFGSSMVSDHITRMEQMDDSQRAAYENALKDTSSTAFMGAVDTTSSLLTSFTLEMVKNPHMWKRAQAEIDAVIGTNRLPNFDDRLSLPYIDAILRETMRMYPPIPPGIPHSTMCSDIYNGFYIPKGATIIANLWAMARDETRYPNAETFIPERFLNSQGMLIDDVPDFVFGFGRRRCPGRHFADASAWCAMVTMLAAFDFNLAKDPDGNDVAPEAKYLNGMSRHALPFSCHITPRAHVTKSFVEKPTE